jgi:hypothetical protein
VNDELRRRIAATDPARDLTTDSVTSDRARTTLESVMAQPLVDLEQPPAPAPRRRWSIRTTIGAAAAAAAVVAAVAVVAVTRDGHDQNLAGPPINLTLPAGDVTAMCLPVDAAILADTQLAFAGTVTSVGDGTVTLDVDHWYHGGDAGTVQIATPDDFTVALDGVDFAEGGRYLITATGGQVLGCGMSGPVSPELEQLYQQAFGG